MHHQAAAHQPVCAPDCLFWFTADSNGRNVLKKLCHSVKITTSSFPPCSQQMFVKGSLEVNGTQQQHPNNVYHDLGITRNKIVTAQFECYQKIMKDNRDSGEGSLLFHKETRC